MRYNTKKNQEYADMGGKHLAVYSGACVVCGRNVYEAKDYHGDNLGAAYDVDPRGTIDTRHACSCLVAEEFGMSGDNIPLCFDCHDTSAKYQAGVKIAMDKWGQNESL